MKYFKEKITNIDSKEVYKIKFINDKNYSIEFYNYGCYIHSINIPYLNDSLKTEDVLLGYNNFQGYFNDEDYINATVGRVCGRISNSQFQLNEKVYHLYANDYPHSLHGGKNGFNKKVWKIDCLSNDNDMLSCKLSYFSKHLEENYPGEINCSTIYKFNNKNEFEIYYEAKTNKDTIVNITNHNYWNFHGHNNFYQNIEDHYLYICGDSICEVNEEQIPSGKLLNVQNTKFNLKNFTKIDKKILNNNGIDHCYEVNKEFKLLEVASIYSYYTKMGMSLFTDQPGLQLYTGNMMRNKYSGKYNRDYGYQYGICLEAQHYPNAINQPNFKSIVLRPGETYSSKIIMKFKNDF